MYDMATELIVEDVHNKIGEMERFIEVSGSFIDNIDLQNGIFEQEGLEILEKMEKEGMSFLLDNDKLPEIPELQETVDVELDAGSMAQYSNLFG